MADGVEGGTRRIEEVVKGRDTVKAWFELDLVNWFKKDSLLPSCRCAEGWDTVGQFNAKRGIGDAKLGGEVCKCLLSDAYYQPNLES